MSSRAASPQRHAHYLVSKAVKRGFLVRPAFCSRCERPTARVHAHHYDYAKPLVVEWLCGGCHTAEHARERAEVRRRQAEERAGWRREAEGIAQLDRRAFGMAIFMARTGRRIKQRDLAQQVNPPITTERLRKLERGRTTPNLALIWRMADAFEVTIGKFMVWIDDERHALALIKARERAL